MRALKIISVVLLVAVILVAGYVWQQRASLAEGMIRQYLAEQNIPVKSLHVGLLTNKQIVLSDVLLGERDTLKADSAVLDFQYNWLSRKLGAVSAKLDGVEMRTQEGGSKLVLAPLKLEAQGQSDGERIVVKGVFYNKEHTIDGSFAGNYTLANERGILQWTTKPISFAANGFTFADLSPAFAGEFTTFPTKLSVNGTVDMKPGDWSVTPNITIYQLPLEALLKDVLGEGTTIAGTVSGDVPLRIVKGGSWRIEPSDLKNIGQVHIAMAPKAAGAAALDAHPQAQVIKAALGNFEVDTMTLNISSTDNKGGVKMDWHFVGRNPDYLGGKKVDLTLAVTANLRDMWRSVTEVERLEREAGQQLKGK